MVTLKDVSDFFKSFDLFGETFTFKSRKRKRYNSLMGGVTSFIFIIYTLYYVMFHLSELLNKNSRKTEISQNFIEYNSVNLMEHKDLIFFICLRDKNMKSDFFLNNNLKIEGNYIDQKNNNTNTNFDVSKINLNIDSCNQNNYLNVIPSFFDKKDFENCKCLNATNTSTKKSIIELRTDKTWANKAFLNIKILPNINLNNNTSNTSDAGLESIAEKFQNYFDNSESKLFLHFPSYYVDKKSIEEPVKKNMISESFEINSNTRINSKLEFSRIDFNEFTSLYDECK
jgi:hypothetical protein